MGVKQLLLGCGIPHLGNIPQKTPPSLPPAACLGKAEPPASPGSLFSFSPELNFLGYEKKLLPLMRPERNVRHLHLRVAPGVTLLHHHSKRETPHPETRGAPLPA